MKYSLGFIVCMFMVGCSTVSEYNKGCRDGITQSNNGNVSSKAVDNFCDDLDAAYRAAQKTQPGRY